MNSPRKVVIHVDHVRSGAAGCFLKGIEVTIKMKTKSALPWFGSDSEVAPQLAAMLDHCKHVTIPFCGGLAILPHLKARAIVANDKHEHAINFYKVAYNMSESLIPMCERTLSHPSELRLATKELCNDESPLVRAWAFWCICWLGRKGKGGTKSQSGMPSIRRTASGGTNASRVRAAADDLTLWAKEFERCEWECRDFRDQLACVADDESCGIYADPPWDGPGESYTHSFGRIDHIDLRDGLSRFKNTTVLVRYGDTSFIRELYKDWDIVDAESRDQTNTITGELWIMNRREKS